MGEYEKIYQGNGKEMFTPLEIFSPISIRYVKFINAISTHQIDKIRKLHI